MRRARWHETSVVAITNYRPVLGRFVAALVVEVVVVWSHCKRLADVVRRTDWGPIALTKRPANVPGHCAMQILFSGRENERQRLSFYRG